jgi:hypothetical protein
VHTGRERFAPPNNRAEPFTETPCRPHSPAPKLAPTLVNARKPPLSTWSANASWANVSKANVLKRSPHETPSLRMHPRC